MFSLPIQIYFADKLNEETAVFPVPLSPYNLSLPY